MTNQEMLTIVKLRGWRLRSRTNYMEKGGARMWYVVDENGESIVSPRYNRSVALLWAVALITKNHDRQQHLRWLETYEGSKHESIS
jgi:hypothetical protein